MAFNITSSCKTAPMSNLRADCYWVNQRAFAPCRTSLHFLFFVAISLSRFVDLFSALVAEGATACKPVFKAHI
eukprot:4565118-Amphidinium_carterae.2